MSLNFISIPTEQTTAITDLILAVQTMICLYVLRRTSGNRGFSSILWSWVFGLLCLASLLGTVAHGFELAPESMRILWCPFSNGPLWIERLASALDEPTALPSLIGGTNYAFNGARAVGASPYGTPDLVAQVDTYLLANGGEANPDDVFVLWAGANDIFFGTASTRPLKGTRS